MSGLWHWVDEIEDLPLKMRLIYLYTHYPNGRIRNALASWQWLGKACER